MSLSFRLADVGSEERRSYGDSFALCNFGNLMGGGRMGTITLFYELGSGLSRILLAVLGLISLS